MKKLLSDAVEPHVSRPECGETGEQLYQLGEWLMRYFPSAKVADDATTLACAAEIRRLLVTSGRELPANLLPALEFLEKPLKVQGAHS